MGFTIPRSAGLEADGPLSLSSLVVLWAKRKEDTGRLKLCTQLSRFTPRCCRKSCAARLPSKGHDRSAEREQTGDAQHARTHVQEERHAQDTLSFTVTEEL